jgi:CBS domain-containing protein
MTTTPAPKPSAETIPWRPPGALLVSSAPLDHLKHVLELFERNQSRRLPVLDDHGLVGVRDIIRVRLDEMEEVRWRP